MDLDLGRDHLRRHLCDLGAPREIPDDPARRYFHPALPGHDLELADRVAHHRQRLIQEVPLRGNALAPLLVIAQVIILLGALAYAVLEAIRVILDGRSKGAGASLPAYGIGPGRLSAKAGPAKPSPNASTVDATIRRRRITIAPSVNWSDSELYPLPGVASYARKRVGTMCPGGRTAFSEGGQNGVSS